MNWNLLACAFRGHATFAPDEPGVRAQLRAPAQGGEAWQCLRCAAFVPGPPRHAGPVSAAPRVRRDDELRSALILRFFAVERVLRAIVFGAIAFAVWRFKYARSSLEQAFNRDLPIFRTALRELGYNVDRSGLVGLIRHTFVLDQHTLTWLALAAAGYAVIEIAEAAGLWLLKRWGEYFAMVATSAGVPYEVYELAAKITVVRVTALVINLALVVYLVAAKRLFGARGGKPAYEARLRSESLLRAAIDAAARAAAPPQPAQPQPAQPQPAQPQPAQPERSQPQPGQPQRSQ